MLELPKQVGTFLRSLLKKIEPMTKNDTYNQIIPGEETDSFSKVARKLGRGFAARARDHDEIGIALPRTLAGSKPNNL
jgi:hypothetical protein